MQQTGSTEPRECACAHGGFPGSLVCVCAARLAGRKLCLRIMAFSLIIVLAIGTIVSVVSIELRQAALNRGKTEAANLSAAFEEQVRYALDSVDSAMELLKGRIEASGGRALELPRRFKLTPELAASTIQIAVLGPDGQLRASTPRRTLERMDLSGRGYFQVHRDNPDAGLFIGKPRRRKISGRMSIQVSRRLAKPDGSFAGVLVFSLAPEFFANLLRGVDAGPRGILTLVGLDAIVRARHSGRQNAPVPLGASLAGSRSLAGAAKADHGAYTTHSVLDGTERIFNWRKVSGYPLLAIAGLAKDEVMAEENRHSLIILALGGAAILLTGAMAAMLLREISGRVRHEIAIQENNAKLNLTHENLKLEHSALRIASAELATGRVRLQETNAELALAQKRSEAASRAKNAFLANMSHELRTPLNAIIGFSEIIRGRMFGAESAAYFDYASDINSAGTHLLEIINNVLDIAKIESGKMELSESVCDLTGILEAGLSAVTAQAKAGGIKILRHYPRERIHVRCDGTRLKQAVINILSNAVKFTPEGGRLEICQEVEPGGGVRVTVKDTGIGMTAEEIDAAFEQFCQIGNSLTKRFEGTGLGLPLARQLARLHDGTISVSSEPPLGTEVSIRLPAHRVMDAGCRLRHTTEPDLIEVQPQQEILCHG